ncbi:hypothetical protein [Mesoplasma photuris]|uniref:hypothetical protein n=1 Tax=Mesoplasma photuris TaxID=217731 RepID=UPI00068C7C44|nr:hypothetical protein [Mesoplasma photuris]
MLEKTYFDLMSIKDLPKINLKSIVTIGVFDGMHQTHQKMIKNLNELAKQNNAVSIVIALESKVSDFFSNVHSNISEVKDRYQALIDREIEPTYWISVQVDQDLISMSAGNFVELLKTKLNTIGIVEGTDFKFGHKAQGNIETLKKVFGQENVYIEERVDDVSTSNIKNLLKTKYINTGIENLGTKFKVKLENQKIIFPSIELLDGNYLVVNPKGLKEEVKFLNNELIISLDINVNELEIVRYLGVNS